LVSWNVLPNWATQEHVTDVTSSGSTDISLGSWGGIDEMVLGDNGLAYANDGATITAFNLNAMTTLWTYEAPAGSVGMNIIASTAGGGLLAKTTDQNGVDTVVRLDPNGNPATDDWSGNQIDYYISNLFTDITPAGDANAYSAAPVPLSAASWFQPSGQQQGRAAAAIDLGTPSTFSTAAPNQTTISSDLGLIANAIANFSSCGANWLQGQYRQTVSSYINGLLATPTPNPPFPTLSAYFGHGSFGKHRKCTGAFSGTDTEHVQGVPLGTVFTVNDDGAFFQATQADSCPVPVGPQQYAGDTLPAQIEILTHELAHQLSAKDFEDDLNDDPAEIHNEGLVDQKCGSMIETVGSVSPFSLTFTSQTVGTPSAAQVVTLKNNFPNIKNSLNIQAIHINAPTITGPNAGDFTQTTTCTSDMLYGASCTYSITFTPQGTGQRTATLNINDNTPHSPQTVALTGTGQ
jgi:hypothetical protein